MKAVITSPAALIEHLDIRNQESRLLTPEALYENSFPLIEKLNVWVELTPQVIKLGAFPDPDPEMLFELAFPFSAVQWWVAYCKTALAYEVRLTPGMYDEFYDPSDFIGKVFSLAATRWQVVEADSDSNTAYCWDLSRGEPPTAPLESHYRECCLEFSLAVVENCLNQTMPQHPDDLIEEVRAALKQDGIEQIKDFYQPHRTILTVEIIANRPIDPMGDIRINKNLFGEIVCLANGRMTPEAAIHRAKLFTEGKEEPYFFDTFTYNYGINAQDAHVKVEYQPTEVAVHAPPQHPPEQEAQAQTAYIPLMLVLQLEGVEAAFEFWAGRTASCVSRPINQETLYTATGEVWRSPISQESTSSISDQQS